MASFAWNYIRNLGELLRDCQPTHPLIFSYYITHRCELQCTYCCDGRGRPFREDVVSELGTAEAKRVLTVLRGASDTLDITGGEPLLRDDLEELLAYAKRLGFRVLLNTKGIDIEARREVLAYTDVLAFSVDSLEPAKLAVILGKSEEMAARVLSGLNFAMTNCGKAGTRLVLAAVATPSNLSDVSQVLRFAMSNSVAFHLSPDCVGMMAHRALYNNLEFVDLMNEVIRFKHKGGPIFGILPYLEGIRDFAPFKCRPLLMPTIRPNGKLYYPCLEMGHADMSLVDEGDYATALSAAKKLRGDLPDCRDRCHIFCHMALSLLQHHPLGALRELKHTGLLKSTVSSA